jgi:hypothetical protein
LIDPASTMSPGSLMRGMDSPVSADSSSAESPEMTVASAGTRSPGRTTMIWPTAISAMGVSTSPSLVSTIAVLGAISARALMPERARPAAMPSSNSPTANRKTTRAASSVAPIMTAPMTAMVISISMVKTEPSLTAIAARRATGMAPATHAAKNK